MNRDYAKPFPSPAERFVWAINLPSDFVVLVRTVWKIRDNLTVIFQVSSIHNVSSILESVCFSQAPRKVASLDNLKGLVLGPGVDWSCASGLVLVHLLVPIWSHAR
jgi:hypothetical protein